MKEREKNKKRTRKKVGKASTSPGGIVESLSRHPVSGGLISAASGISGIAALKEAIYSISQHTSFNESLIVALFGAWLTGTASLTISRSFENAFKLEIKNKRRRRILNTILIAGSFAGFYEGSQVININHDVYLASSPSSPSIPSPAPALTTFEPKIANSTEIVIPPFNSPFEFTGRFVRRTFSPDEWGNIARWQPYIKDAFLSTGLDVTLENNGFKPTELMESILWLESRGNPYALSREGAVGGFQVMPKDGVSGLMICNTGPCFTDRPETWRLFDPETNAYWAAKILNDKIVALKSVKAGIMSYGQQGIGTDYYDLTYALYQKIAGQ